MKKTLVCTVIVLLAISFTTIFAGCTQSPEDLTVFGERIKNAESLEINAEIEATDYEGINLSFTIKRDENKTYVSEFADRPEYYSEIVDGKIYYYYNRNGIWKKSQESYYGYEKDDIVDMELFNGDNYYYDKEKRSLIMKKDANIAFDGMYFDSLKADVGRSKYTFIGEVDMDGYNCKMTLIIKNIDCTVIHVPEIL